MTITFKDNHTEEALEKLLAQFKEKEKLEAVISAFTDQVQLIENTLSELVSERTVDAAEGEILNLFGRVVGQPREARDDMAFRLWIKARILINKSSGLTEEIYEVLRLITGNMDEGAFMITEPSLGYPAHFELTTNFALGDIDPQTIYDILNEMRTATVDFELTYWVTDPVFRFDAGPGFDTGHLAGTI